MVNDGVDALSGGLRQLQPGAHGSSDIDHELTRVGAWEQPLPKSGEHHHRANKNNGNGGDHHELVIEGTVKNFAKPAGETLVGAVEGGQDAAAMLVALLNVGRSQ